MKFARIRGPVACSAEWPGKCGVRAVEADGAGRDERGELAGRVAIQPARGFRITGEATQMLAPGTQMP